MYTELVGSREHCVADISGGEGEEEGEADADKSVYMASIDFSGSCRQHSTVHSLDSK